MTALILLRRHWHVGAIAALLLALAGQQWRLDRARAAHAATEARWQQAQTEAAQLAADRARRQQQAVEQAEQRDTAACVEIREILTPIREEVIKYVAENPDQHDCVDPAVRVLFNQSIAAANAAASGAATGG